MRNGFTFKDRHSSDFGVTVKTRSRPIRPEVKRVSADLACRDGEYDFSAANPFGREFYYDRTFTVILGVYADNLSALQDKLGAIALWLMGGGELIFDDMPYLKWDAKISDEIIYMPEHGGKNASLEASFRVKPFASFIFSGEEGILLDSPGVLLESSIPIGIDEKYNFEAKNGDVIEFFNYGDRPARPLVRIENSRGRTSLNMGDRSIGYELTGTALVDFERQTVTDGNGKMLSVYGDFFEFEQGCNKITVGHSAADKLSISFSFTPQFVYNATPATIDWG